MRFYFNKDGSASVNGIPLGMAVSLPGGVSYVTWNQTDGNSVATNNGYQSIFTDPSPYQSLINGWMTIMAAASNPLTLSQAQSIKSDLIGSIYSYKVTSPIQFGVSSSDPGYNSTVVTNSPGGVYNWDCSHESVDAMTLALASAAAVGAASSDSTLASQINTTFTTLVNEINTAFSTFGTSIGTALSNLSSTANSAISTLVTSIDNAFSNLASSIDSAFANLALQVNGYIGIGGAIYSWVDSFVNAVAGQVNTAFSSLVGAINNTIGDGSGNPAGSINSSFSAIQTATTNLTPYGFVAAPQIGGVGISGGNMTSASVNVGNQTVNVETVSAGTVTGGSPSVPSIGGVSIGGITGSILGNVNWIPIGQATPVTLQGSEFAGLVAAIISRRASLIANKLTFLAAVAALSTITSVISYDATAGWAF